MIVRPSEKSKQDVREIALYIAQEHRSAALRFLDCVEETYSLLGEFPDIGHTPVFDFVEGLKTVLVKNFKHYHVFYRVADQTIRIERVADGRRHLPLLFQYLGGDDDETKNDGGV
jgi:plasmid stabilization system protein ParE